ncbi:MAG TPA: hypothetical protein DCY27_12555 [Desulfobacterales bacterium]|nr:hypothetical protein [Desulfobacterales bacterium]
MQFQKARSISIVSVILLTLLALTGTAQGREGQAAAELIALVGQAEVKSATDAFRPIQVKDQLYERDTIRTLERSKAKLWFKDESVVILGEKTTLEISRYQYDEAARKRQSLLKTISGNIRFIVHKFFGATQPDFNIETEILALAVRGTDGILESAQQDKVYLLEAGVPLGLRNKSTGQAIDLSPMHYALGEKFKPFQINVITPEMYQRLIQEYRLSYDFKPKNLVEPQPPQQPEPVGETGETRILLPGVTQQPLPTIHLPRGAQPSPSYPSGK